VQKITDIQSGTYLLEIYAAKAFKINSKMFSGKLFPPGYYYYSGSAQKNFSKRIIRHLKKEKNIYWHIDHITSRNSNKIKTIFILENYKKEFECKVVKDLESYFNISHFVKNFGNGDCGKGCKSHLLYSTNRINHSHFISRYQSIVRFIPSSRETF